MKQIVKRFCISIVIIIFIGIMCAADAFADSASDVDYFAWQLNEAEDVVITGFNSLCSDADITVPEEIEGRKVVAIGDKAFFKCGNLRSVRIPSTVESISKYAFQGVYSLEEIVVAEDNAYYSSMDGALYNKDKSYLQYVPEDYEGMFVIPGTVRDVFLNAFDFCNKIESVYISSDAILIKPGFYADDSVNVFSYCNGLKEIIVEEGHSEYKSVNGVLYSKDGTELLIMPLGYDAKQYVMSDGVTRIASDCFRHCKMVEHIIFPDSLQRINKGAFNECESLRQLTITEKVVMIDKDAFAGCDNLQHIEANGYETEIWNAIKTSTEWLRPAEDTIEKPIEKTEEKVVYEPEAVWLNEKCIKEGDNKLFTYKVMQGDKIVITGITKEAQSDKRNRILEIPAEIGKMPVIGIAEGAFAGYPLIDVTLSEGLFEIGRGAFYGCNLNEITIPASVYYIAPRAFGANYGMKEINVQEENEAYCDFDGILYNKELTILVQVPANFSKEEFVIPDSVEVIGEYAFGNCRNLKRLVMDEAALEIREKAFWNIALD